MILADRLVGAQLVAAITAALYHRERTGHGQRLDVPMFEGYLSAVLGEHRGTAKKSGLFHVTC